MRNPPPTQSHQSHTRTYIENYWVFFRRLFLEYIALHHPFFKHIHAYTYSHGHDSPSVSSSRRESRRMTSRPHAWGTIMHKKCPMKRTHSSLPWLARTRRHRHTYAEKRKRSVIYFIACVLCWQNINKIVTCTREPIARVSRHFKGGNTFLHANCRSTSYPAVAAGTDSRKKNGVGQQETGCLSAMLSRKNVTHLLTLNKSRALPTDSAVGIWCYISQHYYIPNIFMLSVYEYSLSTFSKYKHKPWIHHKDIPTDTERQNSIMCRKEAVIK